MIRPLLRPVRWSRKRRRLSADCDLIAGRMDGFRGTILLLHRRFFPATTSMGLGISANKFVVVWAVNEVNSVSCRARSITY